MRTPEDGTTLKGILQLFQPRDKKGRLHALEVGRTGPLHVDERGVGPGEVECCTDQRKRPETRIGPAIHFSSALSAQPVSLGEYHSLGPRDNTQMPLLAIAARPDHWPCRVATA